MICERFRSKRLHDRLVNVRRGPTSACFEGSLVYGSGNDVHY